MSAAIRRRRRPLRDLCSLRVCTHCGHNRMVINFPRLPGENRRGDVCTLCLRFPSTIHRAA